ncbi:MAG TPA: hypothetical protein VEB66_17255 [Opitutaceae bacterium]|nr:hypothetical protein [Opitutaceae bacterium]
MKKPAGAPAPAAKADEEEDEEDDKPKSGKEKLFKYGIIGVLVAAALAWQGVKYFLRSAASETVDRVFTKETPPPAPKDAPPEGPQSAQGKAVEKARNAVAANNERQAELPTDEPAAPATPPAADSGPAAGNETPAPTPAPPVIEPAPAVPVEVKPATPPPPPPSQAFRAWVQNLKIGSVRGGSPARLQVGGVTYIPGDLVNPQLGILFESYDGNTRMIRFKDRQTGAIMERRF